MQVKARWKAAGKLALSKRPDLQEIRARDVVHKIRSAMLLSKLDALAQQVGDDEVFSNTDGKEGSPRVKMLLLQHSKIHEIAEDASRWVHEVVRPKLVMTSVQGDTRHGNHRVFEWYLMFLARSNQHADHAHVWIRYLFNCYDVNVDVTFTVSIPNTMDKNVTIAWMLEKEDVEDGKIEGLTNNFELQPLCETPVIRVKGKPRVFDVPPLCTQALCCFFLVKAGVDFVPRARLVANPKTDLSSLLETANTQREQSALFLLIVVCWHRLLTKSLPWWM
jgi:hypothetical protein